MNDSVDVRREEEEEIDSFDNILLLGHIYEVVMVTCCDSYSAFVVAICDAQIVIATENGSENGTETY